MKKWLTVTVSVALAASALTVPAFATDISMVGVIGGPVADRFIGKETRLTENFKKAYEWVIQLHAQKASDGKFDFGESSGEGVHEWAGTNPDDTVHSVMIQDFDGGNSTAASAFLYNNWAAFVCSDAETCDVVILRDAPAEMYAKGDGVNNWQFGDPITNQYWRMEDGVPVLYQQFENGYFRCEEGESWYGEFHSRIDEGADYVEPPEAPPAYGDILEINADGCSWENPNYKSTSVPTDGDVDGNGTTDIRDVMALCRMLARKSTGQALSPDDCAVGDVNGDSYVTIKDVMEICKMLAEKIEANEPDRFAGKEKELAQNFQMAYEWGSTLHAQTPVDGLFSFGKASDIQHWIASDPGDNPYFIMCQNFSGGNSTSANAFSYRNWAAIVCSNPETCEPIILRDAPAELYAKGGGINNWLFGNPITNQYWRMEKGSPVLYQQFENGYLRCEEGEIWHSEFFNKIDEGEAYVEPPEAPPAYGDIYTVNADGCSWENPKYIPIG